MMIRAMGFCCVADDMAPEKLSEMMLVTCSHTRRGAIERALVRLFLVKQFAPGASDEMVEEAWKRYQINKAFRNMRIIEAALEPLEDVVVARAEN